MRSSRSWLLRCMISTELRVLSSDRIIKIITRGAVHGERKRALNIFYFGPPAAPLELFLKGAERGPQNDNTQIERMGIKTMCNLMP